MFQMNCSICGSLIKSPHLVEVQLFLCPQCGDIVVVENVLIAKPKAPAKLNSSLKDALLSAKDKFQLNKDNDLNLQAKHDIDQRLAKFLRRNDFRLNLSHDFFVQTTFSNHKRPAKLLNIGSTGAAVEFFELGPLPENDSELRLQLLVPDNTEPLWLPSMVVWKGKLAKVEGSPTVTTGLQFQYVDERTRSRLWDFIIENETSENV